MSKDRRAPYTVRFLSDIRPSCYYLVGVAWSLEEASLIRQVSGDLVYDEKTGQVEASGAWLWDWEVADANSYAHRKVRKL